MKIKIVYIVSTLKRAGPNYQLFNLLRNLDLSIFDPTAITLSPEESDSIRDQFINSGIKVESLSLSRINGLFFGKKRLLKLIEQLKPDIVHTQGIRADKLSLQLPDHIKKIMTIRNFPQLDYTKRYGRYTGRWMYNMHIGIMKKHPNVVGVSEAVTNNLKQNFGVQAGVIRNGVDTEKFYPAKNADKLKIRKSLSLPEDAIIFVSVGHLITIKQPQLLIEAFMGLKNKENTQLVLIGDGPLRGECEKYAGDAPNIIFTGRIDNVFEYLKASDIYVSSSGNEGMPNAVLEALASGLPCILSDIDPHKEILALEPIAGMAFKTGESESLGKCMEEMIHADLSEKSSKAVELVNSNLSAKKMSEGYQQLYQELLDDIE